MFSFAPKHLGTAILYNVIVFGGMSLVMGLIGVALRSPAVWQLIFTLLFIAMIGGVAYGLYRLVRHIETRPSRQANPWARQPFEAAMPQRSPWLSLLRCSPAVLATLGLVFIAATLGLGLVSLVIFGLGMAVTVYVFRKQPIAASAPHTQSTILLPGPSAR